jgi:HAD superfamily hydrolase (TIGR01509 family)
MSKVPKFIFFDVGNTLLFPNWKRILAPLRARGIQPELDQLRAIERETKKKFDDRVTEGRVDLGFWQGFFADLLAALGVDDPTLAEEMTAATRLSANWDRVRPGTRETLESIGQRHKIGVISNADGKIKDVLATCGIADCFLTITDSGLVGHEKPHPAIFAAALREMNAQAEEALYVGDVYSVDYLGATRSGMQAILFDVSGAYRERGLPRVESLDELHAILNSSR